MATSCRFESDHRHHVGASFISLAPTFFKSQSALMPLLLLSKSNPLRWASIWFLIQPQSRCIVFVASGVFCLRQKRPPSAGFPAPPFPIAAAALGCGGAAALWRLLFHPQETIDFSRSFQPPFHVCSQPLRGRERQGRPRPWMHRMKAGRPRSGRLLQPRSGTLCSGGLSRNVLPLPA